jgi:hypothetical protein
MVPHEAFRPLGINYYSHANTQPLDPADCASSVHLRPDGVVRAVDLLGAPGRVSATQLTVGTAKSVLLTTRTSRMVTGRAARNPDTRRLMPRWVTSAARLGHLSTGTVHCLVGVLALAATFDPEGRATGPQGALYRLAARPFGALLLFSLGVGLLADAVWQGIRAVTDADLAGPGLQGGLERLGWILSGVIHLGLGLVALRLLRSVPEGRLRSHTKAWTATMMAIPSGRWLVTLVALTILAAVGVMIVRAGAAPLDPWLDVARMPSRIRVLTRILCGFGLATRAAVYGIVAGFLLLAAAEANPRVAHGVTGTLRAIRLERHGAPVLAAIGIGFVANGLLELIRARYRRVGS